MKNPSKDRTSKDRTSKDRLIHGDCLEWLRTFAPDSVDVVFYDPPYNVKKKYHNYDDDLPQREYLDWMKTVYDECDRVSRKGVLVYVGSKLVRDFMVHIIPAYAHLIVVHKRAAGVFAGGYMLQYHALFSTVRPVIKCKDLWDDVRLPGEGYFFREMRYDTPGLTGLELTRRVLHHFTVEGDVVLDPFMGTGTTAVAAVLMNRQFIGLEQSEKYLSIAVDRLEELNEKVSVWEAKKDR